MEVSISTLYKCRKHEDPTRRDGEEGKFSFTIRLNENGIQTDSSGK